MSEESVSLAELQKARKKRKAELRNTINQRKSLVEQLLDKPAPRVILKKNTLPCVQITKKPKLKLYENE
ncbi:hypothetical protein [Bathymodiolus heckerae thiotrophic gill symbiont]|uniref:hypothetical protein n=1 Tax=Bathymodiolus heckerae thiotrophic gill symbiont TaxID=1052212 RepID=UPI0010FDCF1E|nr:hypothetical protein [Bathymodiolus heckerae thiotrophic gill symbiont]